MFLLRAYNQLCAKYNSILFRGGILLRDKKKFVDVALFIKKTHSK